METDFILLLESCLVFCLIIIFSVQVNESLAMICVIKAILPLRYMDMVYRMDPVLYFPSIHICTINHYISSNILSISFFFLR